MQRNSVRPQDGRGGQAPCLHRGIASSTREAEGGVRYDAELILSDDYYEGWCEGVDGTGVGEWIEFRSDSKQRIDGIIDFYQGRGRNRIKVLTITAENGFYETFVLPELANINRSHDIFFSKPVYTSWLRITIDEVYPSGEYTYISYMRVM